MRGEVAGAGKKESWLRGSAVSTPLGCGDTSCGCGCGCGQGRGQGLKPFLFFWVGRGWQQLAQPPTPCPGSQLLRDILCQVLGTEMGKMAASAP